MITRKDTAFKAIMTNYRPAGSVIDKEKPARKTSGFCKTLFLKINYCSNKD